MAEWRRVTPVPRRAAVVGVNGPFDLSVNPLSYVTLHVDGLVAAVTAVGVRQPFTDLTNITVSFQGASVVNMNGADLQAMVAALYGQVPYVVNKGSATNGDVVRVSMTIPFSRKKLWLKEGFPATRKGDLQLSLTFAAEGATFQTRNFTVEAVEIPEATPDRFMKMVSASRALVTTDFDFPLPVGNDYAGIMIFEPTLLDAGIATGTIRTVKLLVDNVERVVAFSRFEALREQFEQLAENFDEYAFGDLPALGNYAYIDLDPMKDDAYLFPTDGRADVRLRFELDNAGTVRVIPVELVKVPTAAGGAA